MMSDSSLFNKHTKKIIVGIFLLILIIITVYYLNIDWGHSVLYDGYDYFYGSKTEW